MPFYEILPNSYPHVVLADERKPLAWDFGRMFNLMIASRFVRVTARGMQFTHTPPRIVGIVNVVDGDVGGGELTSWNAVPCNIRTDALCAHDHDLLFFPNGKVDVPPDALSIQNRYTDEFPEGACTSPYSNRLLNVSDVRYEVSLCDLVDANIDVVYDIVQNMLYWRRDSTTTFEYVLIGIVSIYFMSCISGNIISVSTGTPPRNLKRSNLYLVLATWLYLVINLALTNMAFVLVGNDLLLCCVLLGYVAVEGFVAWQKTCIRLFSLSSGISIYTACLMLFAFRIHNTFDNPYHGILAVMFGTRSLLKYFEFRRYLASAVVQCREMIAFRNMEREFTVSLYQLAAVALYVIGDFGVFGVLLYCGTTLSSEHPFDALQQQVLLYLTCLLLATTVALHDSHRRM
jgi:hypothetical protein